jgi:hypothetical protein
LETRQYCVTPAPFQQDYSQSSRQKEAIKEAVKVAVKVALRVADSEIQNGHSVIKLAHLAPIPVPPLSIQQQKVRNIFGTLLANTEVTYMARISYNTCVK